MGEDNVILSKSDAVKHATALRTVARDLRNDNHKVKADFLDSIADSLDPVPPTLQQEIAEYLWPDDRSSGMSVAKNIINLVVDKLKSLDRFDCDYEDGMEKYSDGDYINVNDIRMVFGLENF
jgi:hypothetical protein